LISNYTHIYDEEKSCPLQSIGLVPSSLLSMGVPEQRILIDLLLGIPFLVSKKSGFHQNGGWVNLLEMSICRRSFGPASGEQPNCCCLHDLLSANYTFPLSQLTCTLGACRISKQTYQSRCCYISSYIINHQTRWCNRPLLMTFLYSNPY